MRLHHLVAVGGLAALAGCATTMRGTTQRVAVATDPPGGRCSLHVQGADETLLVAETPGTVEIHRRRSTLEVRCTRDGYFDAVERFEPVHCGLTHCERHAQVAGSAAAVGAGVAVLGGVTLATAAPTLGGGLAIAGAGVVAAPVMLALLVVMPVGGLVDYASGAAFEYPPAIAILMVPSRFPSEAARDAYFADLERRFEGAFAERRRETEATCARWNCGYLRREDEAWFAERRAWLAARRAMATVVVERDASPIADP